MIPCIVCSYATCNASTPTNVVTWKDQFRVLYFDANDIWISGVGLHNDPNIESWTAPLDYAARWDDGPGPLHKPMYSRKPLSKSRNGYIFHDACWSLLKEVYYPSEVPLARLLDVLKSLRSPMQELQDVVNPDFCKLIAFADRRREDGFYTWDNEVYEGDPFDLDNSGLNDPYHVPRLEELLATSQRLATSDTLGHIRRELNIPSLVVTNDGNLTKLPREICDRIACFLPMPDVLNLRLASRAFVFTIFNQQFWASRFSRDFDRCWFFEARDQTQRRDWRLLYLLTKPLCLPPAMMNRWRIWDSIQRITNLVGLRYSGRLECASPMSPPELVWAEVTADLRHLSLHALPFKADNYERKPRAQYALVPDNLYGVVIYMASLDGVTFITGIEFQTSEKTAVTLGYHGGRKRGVSVRSLRGFNVALDSRGIHAIQVVDDRNFKSRWIGDPRKLPITRRLASIKPEPVDGVVLPAVAIRPIFDEWKMVGLSVGRRSLVPPEEDGMSFVPDADTDMRNNRLWYRSIPDPRLYLRDIEFWSEAPGPKYGFAAYHWTLFGGDGGIFLPHLTGMSVFHIGKKLCHLEFTYDRDDIPFECRKLGECRLSYDDHTHATHFPIDGPEGEWIEDASVQLKKHYKTSPLGRHSLDWVKLESFEVITDRHRRCRFGPSVYEGILEENEDIMDEPVPNFDVEGAVTTGFHICVHEELGIIKLGTIVEAEEEL